VDWTAERVRALRAALRFTHEEFAEHLGVAVRTVRNWQSGRHAPTPALQRVLDAALAALDDQQQARWQAAAGSPGDGAAGLLDQDLWALRQVLGGEARLPPPIDEVERDVARLHQIYAQASPGDLLAVVRHHLRLAVGLLAQPQPVRHRRRLCWVTAHLAGLRAWLAFDLRDERTAEDWFRVGLTAADEADDPTVSSWMRGAASLVPSYRGAHDLALTRIRSAQRQAGSGAAPAVRAWTHALEARAWAALGRAGPAREALALAAAAGAHAGPEGRLHGMDFRGGALDLSYYEGTSLVLLGEPRAARPVLLASLGVQGSQRRRARCIVLLALATTHVQEREVEEACRVAGEAMSLPSEDRTGPIETRWRELRGRLEPWAAVPAVRDLDDVAAG